MLKSIRLERRSVEYRACFEKIDDVFGRANVVLRKFDPQTFPSGCVVRDFCARLGTGFPTKCIIRDNESLPLEVVALLYT